MSTLRQLRDDLDRVREQAGLSHAEFFGATATPNDLRPRRNRTPMSTAIPRHSTRASMRASLPAYGRPLVYWMAAFATVLAVAAGYAVRTVT